MKSENELINYLCSVLKIELQKREVKFWNPVHEKDSTLMVIQFAGQTVLVTLAPHEENKQSTVVVGKTTPRWN